ncbi:MAG: hypothetical protein D6788_05090 [Planctomycetota bacterium]|nr:MAG: hypothetical protein D6788_05090 [Planctomycetota bacterium]
MRWAVGLALSLGVCPGLVGCRQKSPDIDIVALEGKIESIEQRSDTDGTITVVYYSEKHQQELAGRGRVTADTEITINGAQAKLADLRKGDRVRGEVRIEKKSGKRVQTVLKIHVTRPKPLDAGEG